MHLLVCYLNIRMNFAHRPGILYVPHRMAEGIWPYQQDKKYADPQGSWYRSARKKIDQKIVHGAEFKIKLHQEETRM